MRIEGLRSVFLLVPGVPGVPPQPLSRRWSRRFHSHSAPSSRSSSPSPDYARLVDQCPNLPSSSGLSPALAAPPASPTLPSTSARRAGAARTPVPTHSSPPRGRAWRASARGRAPPRSLHEFVETFSASSLIVGRRGAAMAPSPTDATSFRDLWLQSRRKPANLTPSGRPPPLFHLFPRSRLPIHRVKERLPIVCTLRLPRIRYTGHGVQIRK